MHEILEFNIALNQLFGKITNFQNVIITFHRGPDGDAIGSGLGLAIYLKRLGINVRVLSDSPIPDNLQFLPYLDIIEIFDEKKDYSFVNSADAIFFLDLNSISRTGYFEPFFANSPAYKVVIDHHLEPQDFADLFLVDTFACSTAELIFRVIKNDKNIINLSKEIAVNLYTGIMTDTGGFRFDRTTAEVHRIVAELIESGADPEKIYDLIFNQSSLNIIKLYGMALQSLQIFNNGVVCFMSLSAQDLQICEAKIVHTEGFVAQTLAIQGVKIGGIFIEDAENGEIKISLRSKDNFSVREVAAKFGGGGHKYAAGLRMKNVDLEEAIKLVLENTQRQAAYADIT